MRLFRGYMMMAAVLALSGCGFGDLSSIASAGTAAPPGGVADAIGKVIALQDKVETALQAVPTALNSTTIDETALRDALKAYDAALSGVDFLVQIHKLERNSPAALTVRRALVDTKHWLLAASAARKAGSATQMAVALSQASLAVAQARQAIGN
jgi:hypothetical protein